MSNLLTDLSTNINEILGETVSDLWLEIAWDMLISELGYDPSYGEETDETVGTGDKIVYLQKRPVKELVSVYINEVAKDLDDFKVYKERACKYDGVFQQGQIKNYKRTMSNFKNDDEIEITYNGGYTSDEFPKDLLLLVCDMIKTSGMIADGSANLKSYSISDISYSFRVYTETNSRWNNTLDKYRSP
jgi:hypothetical protein